MNIYYDNIIYHLQSSGGISRYWHELTRRFLSDNDCGMRFIEHPSPCDSGFRRDLDISQDKIIREPGLPISVARYLPVRISRPKTPCIFHSSYYRDMAGKKAAKIVTVHDFTYEYFVTGIKRFVHSAQKGRAVMNADGIICVSSNTKADLLRFYPDIPQEKIAVVFNGVSGDFAPSPLSRDGILAKHGLKDDKYAVFIGERRGYKNFGAAVLSAARAGCGLLIIGGRKPDEEETALLDKYLKGRYRRFGFMQNSEICELFSIAHCLLYTSLYEGFGIPVLEAMRCGCPVVASYSSSLPEAAGDAGLLSREMTPESFASLMSDLDNKDLRRKVIEKGFAHSAKFSWNRCFSETKAFYQKILSAKA